MPRKVPNGSELLSDRLLNVDSNGMHSGSCNDNGTQAVPQKLDPKLPRVDPSENGLGLQKDGLKSRITNLELLQSSLASTPRNAQQ